MHVVQQVYTKARSHVLMCSVRSALEWCVRARVATFLKR